VRIPEMEPEPQCMTPLLGRIRAVDPAPATPDAKRKGLRSMAIGGSDQSPIRLVDRQVKQRDRQAGP
jgi:hypothetical protein